MLSRLAVLLALVSSSLVPASVANASAPAETGQPSLHLKRLQRPERPQAGAEKYDPHTVLVKFRPGTSAATRRAAIQDRKANDQGSIAGYVKVRTAGAAKDLLKALRNDPAVQTASFDYARSLDSTPNDYYYVHGKQQNLNAVRLPYAWNVVKNTSSQVIAVLDTGVDTHHEDLVGHLTTSYDAVVPGRTMTDIEGHGTMVAGIAAANTNNTIGVAGAAWSGKIMPVKVFRTDGYAYDSEIARGVRWAADHGARIINLSLGGKAPDGTIMHDAIIYATSKGVLVVAAAGNSGDATPHYPAAFPEVLAVGATDNTGALTDFSTSGDWVDVSAPGFQITSTFFYTQDPAYHDYYATGDGTSFSSPLVAGIAAIVRTRFPSLTPAQVIARIKASARDAGPRGIDPYHGYGFVDAYAALGGARVGDLGAPHADHNDMPARATALAGSTTGTIGAAGDVDWYVINSGTARSVRITVTPAAFDEKRPQNFDPVVAAYDTDLRLLGGEVDEALPGDPETFVVAVPAGLSYIAVRSFNGGADFRPYTVSAGTTTATSTPVGAQLWVRDVSPEDFGVTHTLAIKPVVTFQRDLNQASVTTSTVQLRNGKTGATVPTTVAYDAGTRKATITPSSDLQDITPYRIVVGAVQDTLGATNNVPVSTTFRPDLLPTAVTGFDATGWYSSATLHWTLPSLNDLSQVIVRRSTGGAAPASPTQGVGVYAGTGTSATATGLGWGGSYIFRAWVKDKAGQYSPFAETKLGGSRARLAVSTTSLTYGGTVTLTGHLLKGDGTGPIAGAALRLYARQKGTSSWRLLHTGTTDSTGTTKYVYKPSFGNDFQWRWYSGSPDLIGSGSNIVGVGVRPIVSEYVSRTTLPLGGTVTVSGGVNPYHVGQVVYLQHYIGSGRWVNVASGKLSSKSTYAFTLKPASRGTYSYRVVKPADADHLLAVSPTRSFKVR